MLNKTIAEIISSLEQRQISSVELTQLYLDRIKQLNPQLNAFITVTEEQALNQAQQADVLRSTGDYATDTHPLLGIPMAEKDIFCTEGIKTSCGSKMLDNFISPYDSTVTANFKKAGYICLGKTNMDEFAMGSSNETSFYGSCKNPWDLECVPGGSSGGSASAVAAYLTPAASGTDTGGSIRQPASFCGITGIKPTYGRVSRWGMIAFASSLDQAGPMTRNAEDAAILLNVMAGYDPKDSTCINRPVPDYQATLNDSLENLKIGLPKQFFSSDLDDNIAQLIHNAVTELEKQGAQIKEIDLPHSHLSVPAYYIIAPAECSSNLSRFDGVRYGYRSDNAEDLESLYKNSRSEAFGEEVKRRILIGTYALSEGFYDAYYLKAQQVRRLIKEDFNQAFKEVDVILGPTTPSGAFQLGANNEDPVTMYLNDIFTIAVNLAGLPAMSVPAGFSQNKPIGLQLIGNDFEEARLLNVAHQFQRVTDWHQQKPKNFD